MKKLLMLVMCLIMSLAIAGCGGSSDKQAAQPAKGGKVLKVATDANYPPFEFYQEKSKSFAGFDIELMNAVAREMGYDRVEYQAVEFKDILKGLNERQYDAAIAGISITDERRRSVQFSKAYVNDSFKVVVPKTATQGDKLADLEGKRVAVEAGTAGEAMAKQAKAAEVIPAQGTEAALKLMADGRADCVIANSLVVDFFLQHGYADRIKFAGTHFLLVDAYGIALAQGDQQTVDKVNAALDAVKRSGEYSRIYKSYFGDEA